MYNNNNNNNNNNDNDNNTFIYYTFYITSKASWVTLTPEVGWIVIHMASIRLHCHNNNQNALGVKLKILDEHPPPFHPRGGGGGVGGGGEETCI